jgi:hypothetical protein
MFDDLDVYIWGPSTDRRCHHRTTRHSSVVPSASRPLASLGQKKAQVFDTWKIRREKQVVMGMQQTNKQDTNK